MGRIKTVSNADLTAKPKTWLAPAYKPGQSGNPNGRPIGARSKITEKFLLELQNYFEKEGPGLIERAGQEAPAALVAVYAKLLPKEAHIEISGGVSLDLTVDQRTRIAESWLMSQSDRVDAIEGEAVRCNSAPALPGPDGESDVEPADLDDPPDREPEPVAKRSTNAGVHRQAKRAVHSRIIGSRGGNND